MTDTGAVQQTLEIIDRQLIAREMTKIMTDPASDAMSLPQIKRQAVDNLKWPARPA